MRIAYAGTPAFAATGLAALLAAGFEVPLVLSQPDRPAGRGQRLQASPVRQLAQRHGIPVLTPASLHPDRGGEPAREALQGLRAARLDALVVAAYGLLLPQAVLDIPAGLPSAGGPVRALNIHASLLPRWRGAAPVARAIEAGDARSGVTIMQMDAGLDTGPMLLTGAVDIAPQATAGELTERLAALGAQLIVEALHGLQEGRITPRPQPLDGVTYAHKIAKHEAWVDWTQAGALLAARVRAFDPFPGACSSLEGMTIKIWRAEPADLRPGVPPGTIVEAGPQGLLVACGQGALRITDLQRPGGRRLAAREFLAGLHVASGAHFGSPPSVAGGPA